MILLNILETTLPLTNPVLKFFIILLLILFAPILLNKLKIPHILGLIIAGAIVGPNGFNLLLRDSGIILSGTAGLLYIMFLAGLEINMTDFKKNSTKSITFGLYTFSIPMIIGTLTGIYVLKFSVITSVLLASMFASHTLIAYPLISKIGVAKNRAVNIAVGGTMITDTLALLVLAVIVGMSTGQINSFYWIRLSISILAFGLFAILIFPIVGRWFLKRYSDNVSQYVFVLAMVFFGAVLAEAAGIEAIIGAFLAGLTLNRLIPYASPLMNRIQFVGNAIFIPFFLIGVGMLVDYKAFINDFETIKVAAIMTVVATVAKLSAAWLTQKSFKLTVDERRLIFGLSNAQAAATLAAVMIGYNVILGETSDGEPIRLLNENVLNGTIVMILVTCTIATLAAQKGGKRISLKESLAKENHHRDIPERILIPVSNPDTIDELISLSTIIKSDNNRSSLFALNIINSETRDSDTEARAGKMLETAAHAAAATDIFLNKLIRYDGNIANGITAVVHEQNITDIVLGLHIKKTFNDSFFGNIVDQIVSKCNTTTFVYKPVQPISTIKRHVVIVPPGAEDVVGFPFWFSKILNIAKNTGSRMVFYLASETLKIINEIPGIHDIDKEFTIMENRDDFLMISRNIRNDDNIIVVLSRIHKPSYNENMAKIPDYLSTYFPDNSCILIYPMQLGVNDFGIINLNNPSLNTPIYTVENFGKVVTRLFKPK